LKHLGIDIGLISVKVTLIEDGHEQWTEMEDHEGNIQDVLLAILEQRDVDGEIKVLTTGNAGRNQLRTEKAIPPQAIEAALDAVGEKPDAVVSLGGESIVVYTMSDNGRTLEAITGDKCAAGTGEFFRQQLGRMDLDLSVLDRIPEDTKPQPLSSRCSVFMKSDCTHKLNKREATKEEIVVSLADVMASKVMEFFTRARVDHGRVLLIGGVTRNRFLRKFLQQRLPGVEFITPPQAAYFEAFGAAHLAARYGANLPARGDLFDPAAVSFERFSSLAKASDLVTSVPSSRGEITAGREYVLGIDGGSTTTKAVLIDAETKQICAEHYGRTHGDPVEALRQVLTEIRGQVREAIGEQTIKINLAATTGSSREVLGVFIETPGIYNEIIAHTTGTTHFRPEIDTIFEIGGQDAKYVYIKNGVPIDYAMNEACSAGTGSFLEETAQGDLNIRSAPEIGPIALKSEGPLRFGEHCSAFINSDIRKAIQEGAGKPDIMAGIVFSIVSNYLNRVVGNRTIGESIVLQGGVAKNPAVPIAFAAHLGKPILVPPDPELLGAFGVALLALQKHEEGSLTKERSFELDDLITRPIEHGRVFTCKTCDNLCPIQTLLVGQAKTKYFFGGRCDQYANLRKHKKIDTDKVDNFVKLREQLLFEEYAPDEQTLRQRTEAVVGIPRAFTVYSLWPLYSWFFHDLGVRTVLSKKSLRAGVQRAESAYCLPGEIAHGMTEELVQANVDYYFLPHLLGMKSMEDGVPATLCPLTQGLPYYLRPAFDIPDDKILRPVIDFSSGYHTGSEAFIELAERLGFTKEEGLRAFRVGMNQQLAFGARLREVGSEILARATDRKEVIIALFGRPYNAFAPEANMGIPRKFISRGYRVVPFDFFPVGDEEISENMYWYYGQQNLKAAQIVKQHPSLYLAYLSNFGCAPDSFMLHFIRWFMGTKPYLVLELDSHTADAGIDTRIEAFLDIITGYRLKADGLVDRPFVQRYKVHLDGANTYLTDRKTGERLSLKHPRVRLVWPSMGLLSTEAICAVTAHYGMRSEYLPVADIRTTQIARNVASGKECIPTLMVLGQILKLLNETPPEPDEVLAVIVPRTTGPCRTGQYGPFYERTFSDLGIENVTVLNLCSDSGYAELGPDFRQKGWYALALADFFKDMETALRLVARRPDDALRIFRETWEGVLRTLTSDLNNIYPYLEREVTPRLAAIPRKRELDEIKKVIAVGEIYVRRDDFSTSELLEHMVANGIFLKVTGITEWLYYCDYSHEKQVEQKLNKLPWYRWPFAEGFGDWAGNKVTQAFMRAIEERFRAVLEPTGLIPHSPHDMREIMVDVDQFSSLAFETEATVSSLTGALAVRQGYDGIVAIAPFACLPGRLIKAIMEPYSRKHEIPFISLEADGLRFPPNVISRLEIFMLNVLRRGEEERGNGFKRVVGSTSLHSPGVSAPSAAQTSAPRNAQPG
jgi:predicted CoA-substrate-specific enzyme activase